MLKNNKSGFEELPIEEFANDKQDFRDEFVKKFKGEDLKLQQDQIKGGLADNMTAKEIADKHNVDVAKIKAQLSKGIVVEMEHTNDPKKAVEIALDHLVESSIYYDELEKVESNFDKKSNQK